MTSSSAQTNLPTLSDEQQAVLDAVEDGHDVIVDSVFGSGKTSTIQALCQKFGTDRSILYLTYSKLLKADAQARVRFAKVQNYHGIVYPSLLRAGISCGISESIAAFNRNFKTLSKDFPRYDMIVIDEYQDINEEYAQLIQNIVSLNPFMQIVMVGDMSQKISTTSRFDQQDFAKTLCKDPAMLAFTRSFRSGEALASMMSFAWNKPITGANPHQRVLHMSPHEAIGHMMTLPPHQILALGKRKGRMSAALNILENEMPETFNKNTLYASVRERGEQGTPSPDAAIFTTFDGCKGMERDVCFVYDYDDEYWSLRNGFDNADPLVLRNVFCVAATRGKSEIIFVTSDPQPEITRPPEDVTTAVLGDLHLSHLNELPEKRLAEYQRPFTPSTAFDFTYAENVEECFALLELTRLDDGSSEPIEMARQDGLIDLSAPVGNYQEALHFNDYSVRREIANRLDNPHSYPLAPYALSQISDDPWRNALALTMVDTSQQRYFDQVSVRIDDACARALTARLAQHLPRTARAQVSLQMQGLALRSRTQTLPLSFSGICDAIHDAKIWELKFVSELTHPMFLQTALYLAMTTEDIEEAILWNTCTDERWSIRIPDQQRFLDAVITCITKQDCRQFIDQRTIPSSSIWKSLNPTTRATAQAQLENIG